MSDDPDDLDALLAPGTATSAASMRDAILQSTERVLKRRRFARRCKKLGGIAALLVLGIAIGRESRPERIVVPNDLLFRAGIEPQVVVVPLVIPVPVPASEPQSIARTEPATAAQTELLAEQTDDRGEAARLYRLAGDKFLNDDQDYRNAARCYRLYLARAGDPALTPTSTDSWLLTSLKNAVFQEKFHVAKTDG